MSRKTAHPRGGKEGTAAVTGVRQDAKLPHGGCGAVGEQRDVGRVGSAWGQPGPPCVTLETRSAAIVFPIRKSWFEGSGIVG